MELDLSKYPLQELYKRFEEVEQKEANVSKFEKTVLDEKVKLQNFEGFSLDDLESLIDGNEVISHDQLNLLTKKLESVSRELKDIKTIFHSEVPVYIHFETRRRFRKSGLEASYKKAIKHIIKEFEKLRSIEKEVQEINDKIVKEISNKHIFKNAMVPLVSGIPGSIIGVIGGATLTETVFAFPGMGKMLIDSVKASNNNMVVGLVFIFTSVSIFSYLIGDIWMTIIDPRIKLTEKGGK